MNAESIILSATSIALTHIEQNLAGAEKTRKRFARIPPYSFFFFFVKMRKKLCRMNNRVYNSSTVTSFINLMYNSLTNVSIPFETKKDPKSVILIGYITYQNFYITYVQ